MKMSNEQFNKWMEGNMTINELAEATGLPPANLPGAILNFLNAMIAKVAAEHLGKPLDPSVN